MNATKTIKNVDNSSDALSATRSISDYDITLSVGNVNERISLDVFAAICDNYLYNDICSACQDPTFNTIVYSFYRNKVRCSVKLTPKWHVS